MNSNDIKQSSQRTTDYERENVIIDIDFAPIKFRLGEKDGNVVTNDIDKPKDCILAKKYVAFTIDSCRKSIYY